MSSMLDKAKASWKLSEEYWSEVISLNFAANRFYYSLYQIADEVNKSPAGGNRRKYENESFHSFMRNVVRDVVPPGKRNLFQAFQELRELRDTADYQCENITLDDLDKELIHEAKELFTLLEQKLSQRS